ncbi:MAG TPA: gfo/Idh/MocA family oxidoreductase, partial [Clostridia bacterium]|nr:gfo/Idh/MocA family oxidoreductase [Clostridia bacterium]
MRKIKVGHIGTGCQHSGAVMQTMLKMPDVYDVVGVVDTDGKQDPDFNGVKRLTEEELFAIEG